MKVFYIGSNTIVIPLHQGLFQSKEVPKNDQYLMRSTCYCIFSCRWESTEGDYPFHMNHPCLGCLAQWKSLLLAKIDSINL